MVCPGNDRLARFQGLAQGVEHVGLKFRQLVEEKDAEMGEADFARLGTRAAAYERRHAGGVMR